MKKAQISMEFTILLGIMFMVFLVYFAVIESKALDISEASDRVLLEQVGMKIKAEFDAAAFVDNGFQHRFNLPATILGKDYNLTLCAYYEEYFDDTNNIRGKCNTTEEIIFPEIVMKYADSNSEEVVKISRNIVGAPAGLIRDVGNCLRKENNILYINSGRFPCV